MQVHNELLHAKRAKYRRLSLSSRIQGSVIQACSQSFSVCMLLGHSNAALRHAKPAPATASSSGAT